MASTGRPLRAPDPVCLSYQFNYTKEWLWNDLFDMRPTYLHISTDRYTTFTCCTFHSILEYVAYFHFDWYVCRLHVHLRVMRNLHHTKITNLVALNDAAFGLSSFPEKPNLLLCGRLIKEPHYSVHRQPEQWRGWDFLIHTHAHTSAKPYTVLFKAWLCLSRGFHLQYNFLDTRFSLFQDRSLYNIFLAIYGF